MLDTILAEESAVRVANSVTFWLPNLPPSVNEIYQPGYSIYSSRPQWKIKAEWLIWQAKMQPYILPFPIAATSFVHIDLLFFYDFFYPKQRTRLRTVDTQNMCKFAIDTIAKKLGFNDRIVKSGSWDSKHAEGSGKARVTLIEVRQ